MGSSPNPIPTHAPAIDTWVPYSGHDAILLAFVLLAVATVLALVGRSVKEPIAIRRPGRTVAGFMIVLWALAIYTFPVAAIAFGLQLYQMHIPTNAPPTHVTPITLLSVAATFFIVFFITRKYGWKVAFFSALIGAVVAPLIFELPFDIVVMGRTYPPIQTNPPQPAAPIIYRELFFFPFFMAQISTMSLLTLLPSMRISRHALYALAGMFLVFALWALVGFGFPSEPLPLTFNIISKLLSFVTVIALFTSARAGEAAPSLTPNAEPEKQARVTLGNAERQEMAHVSNTSTIAVSHLRKNYGDVRAMEDVSFEVNEGEIFGLLGPNGAGKTTTVECITGLRKPDAGTISILGLDPQVDRDALHAVVGVQLQSSAFPDKLKVGEILDMYQSFYRNPANPKELANALGLGEKLSSYYKTLSGGQKQRVSIASALIGRPKIAVLDEMTTGLDPQARLDTWNLIEKTRDRGTTIVLVTHYMEEAERLCDRVALIDYGRIVALDTPHGLTEKVTGGKQVRFVPSKPFNDRLLIALPEVNTVERQGKRVKVVGSGQLVNAVIQTLAQYGIEALDIQSEGATLEDAFVKLTGRHIDEDEEAEST